MYNINTETPLLSKKQHSTCSLFYSKKKCKWQNCLPHQTVGNSDKKCSRNSKCIFFFNTLHQQFVFAHNKIKFCDDQQQVLNAS